MLPKKIDLDYCWRAFLRRKWYVVVPFCLIFTAGVIYASTRPKIYQASALVLVKEGGGARAYVRTTISGNIEERIVAIKAKITSKENLETIVGKYQLYTEEDHSKPEKNIQEKIALLASNISLEIPRVGKSFTIAFNDSNPRKAMEVANKLAGDFIMEHMRTKEDETVGATQFLENELQRLEAVLQEKELALTTFRQQHSGSLPGQLSANLALRAQIQQKIESIERNLDQARSQRIMLQGQVSTFKSSLGSDPLAEIGSIETGDEITTSPDLIKLKEKLKALRFRYTENHPDVVRLKKRIAQLEEEQSVQTSEGQPPVEDDALTSGGFLAGQATPFEFQLASIDQTIKNLQIEKEELKRENRRLDQLIADTPKSKLELANLERDYDAIKQQYNSLLAKKLDSELVANLEKQDEVTEFKVARWARQPTQPVSPKIPRLILIAAFAALAAGFGLGFGLEYIDQTFRDYKELGQFLQLPVLAVIPQVETTTGANDSKKRFMLVALCITGVILAVIGIGIWLWMNGNLQELVEKIRTAAAWMNGTLQALVEKILTVTAM
jgi:polysaccharide chain length determinant protein (PEP-CTERM system associated)